MTARFAKRLSRAVLLAWLALGGAPAMAGLPGGDQAPPGSPVSNPVITVETSKGTFSFETFPADAAKTVAHVVELVARGFYDGQRIHRAVPGFVVQFGDPQSRDDTRRDLWGRGTAAGSGQVVGVAEINAKRTHRRGAVALAHPGNPAHGDSQIYITLAARKDLDRQYAVFGQVVSGGDVLDRLKVGDVVIRVDVKR